MVASLTGVVGGLRWTLAVTPEDRSARDRMDNMAVDAAYHLIRTNGLECPRVPHHFLLDRGWNEDAEAGVATHAQPDATLFPVEPGAVARLELSNGAVLVIDPGRSEIALDRDGVLTMLWGASRPDALAVAMEFGAVSYAMESGERIRIDTSLSADHGNGLNADHITVEENGHIVSLHAVAAHDASGPSQSAE